MSIPSKLSKRVTADEGAAMLEYAMMIALIALALIVATTTLGEAISALFTDVVSMLP